MNELMPTQSILRGELDERHYLESLLTTALERDLLAPQEFVSIQRDLLALLARSCEAYTGGMSSSVPTETAEELTNSLCFTLGVWLKEFSQPEEALRALVREGISSGYERGYSRLLTLVRSTRQFYRQVMKYALKTENEVYHATLGGGISGFFKLYRPEFTAHLFHITADYPTLLFPAGYEGLEFIRLYLRSIHAENLFCRGFDQGAVRQVLFRHAVGCGQTVQSMVCNLCEPVLATALACALAGSDLSTLSLTDGGAQRVQELLSGPVVVPLEPYLEQVLAHISTQFDLKDSTAEYMRRVLAEQTVGIEQMILLVTKQ